jgi:hypothetical protein
MKDNKSGLDSELIIDNLENYHTESTYKVETEN